MIYIALNFSFHKTFFFLIYSYQENVPCKQLSTQLVIRNKQNLLIT